MTNEEIRRIEEETEKGPVYGPYPDPKRMMGPLLDEEWDALRAFLTQDLEEVNDD